MRQEVLGAQGIEDETGESLLLGNFHSSGRPHLCKGTRQLVKTHAVMKMNRADGAVTPDLGEGGRVYIREGLSEDVTEELSPA